MVVVVVHKHKLLLVHCLLFGGAESNGVQHYLKRKHGAKRRTSGRKLISGTWNLTLTHNRESFICNWKAKFGAGKGRRSNAGVIPSSKFRTSCKKCALNHRQRPFRLRVAKPTTRCLLGRCGDLLLQTSKRAWSHHHKRNAPSPCVRVSSLTVTCM